MKTGALDLLSRHAGVLVALTLVVLPLGAATAPCLLGLPILAWGYGRLVRALLMAAHEQRGEKVGPIEGGWRVGTLAVLGVGLLCAAQIGSATILAHFTRALSDDLRLPLIAGGSLLGAAVSGAALVPLAFAPFFAAQGIAGWVDPLSRSFALAARLGPLRVALLGARSGLALGVGLALAGLLVRGAADPLDPVPFFLVLPLGLLVGPPFVGAWLAQVYARERAEPREAVAAAPRLRALQGTLAPSVAVLAGSILFAAVTPTPMQRIDPPPVPRGFHPEAMALVGLDELRLPGTTVRVSLVPTGLSVEAHDGGGAGEIPSGFSTPTQRPGFEISARAAVRDGVPGFVLYLTDGVRWAATFVDRDGVRRDDGLGARVSARLGTVGLVALSIGLLALLGVAWTVGVELTAARSLEAPRLDTPGNDPRGLRRALQGNLRLSEGAQLVLDRGTPRALGEAYVEALGGEVRLRLPQGNLRIFDRASAARWDGVTVTVLSRFTGLAPRSLREASTPWPADAVLVLGSRDDATRALVDRATRIASYLNAGAVLAFVVATATLWIAL